MRYVLTLILCCAFGLSSFTQVFRTYTPPPPPPPPGHQTTTEDEQPYYKIEIDTSFSTWLLEDATVLNETSGDLRSQFFEEQAFGRICAAGDRLGVATVQFLYEEGKSVVSNLIMQVLQLNGEVESSLQIPHDDGISLIGLTSDRQQFYLAYQKSINSGDRDMYVAKVNRAGQLLWETRVGKRFGTSGMQLLQLDQEGNLILFAQMYKEVGFDRISAEGQLIDRKMLYFVQDFSPKSFLFKPDGSIIGIGAYQEYKGRDVNTSSVLFELDQDYVLKQFRQIESTGLDQAQDVALDEAGNCYVLINTQNSEKSYLHDKDFITIGKLDQDFNLVESTNLQNTDNGTQLRLIYQTGQGLLAYERIYNPGPTFLLFSLDADLQLKQSLTAPGRFGSPKQMLIHEQRLFLLCGDLKSNLLSFDWKP